MRNEKGQKGNKAARLRAALWTQVPVCLLLVALTAIPGRSAGVDEARGREILAKFVEVNRYWLMAPPEAVQNFSYVLQRLGGTQEFKVTKPANTPRARLQGVTYSAMVHQLARTPESTTIQKITEEAGRVRLDIVLDPPVRGACGNGVENSWNGYHSLGGNEGFLVLDSRLWVPLEAGIGRLRETFGEFVTLDQKHYFPLGIRVKLGGDTEYAWRFRLYEPGLWLFDDSYSVGRRLAWVEKVRVNGAEAKVAFETTASVVRAESEKGGAAKLEAFLSANGHWLLPSLEARRGLVYEYRQEEPYLERVVMDPEGNVLVRLERNKESPDRPTRQRLWLADGSSYLGNAQDRFVKLEKPAAGDNAGTGFQHDRMAQHVAMGLALDCALTRLAREPETFWAETRAVPEHPDQYLLVLHAKRDARLFTGTMLAFSSWSFMHDVGYERSEILCETGSNRPIEEKDFSGKSELKGHYFFEDWLAGPGGAAPGRIRAIVPYEKDDKDQSLEMSARWRWVNDLWLLDEVESHFRGGDGGSTGKVTVRPGTAEDYALIRNLLQAAGDTERILAAIEQSPEGRGEFGIGTGTGEWSPVAVKAAWTDQARQAIRSEEQKSSTSAVIGLCRARLVESSDSSMVLELEGISTASWKEFETQWKVTLGERAGLTSFSTTTNLAVRAENGPTTFLLKFGLPRSAALPERVMVEGSVARMSGAYHGHGIWFKLAKQK